MKLPFWRPKESSPFAEKQQATIEAGEKLLEYWRRETEQGRTLSAQTARRVIPLFFSPQPDFFPLRQKLSKKRIQEETLRHLGKPLRELPVGFSTLKDEWGETVQATMLVGHPVVARTFSGNLRLGKYRPPSLTESDLVVTEYTHMLTPKLEQCISSGDDPAIGRLEAGNRAPSDNIRYLPLGEAAFVHASFPDFIRQLPEDDIYSNEPHYPHNLVLSGLNSWHAIVRGTVDTLGSSPVEG